MHERKNGAPEKRKPSAAVGVWLSCCWLCAAIFMILLVGYLLRGTYRNAREQAAITTQNMTKVLEGTISAVIGKSELALFSVADEYRRQSSTGQIDSHMLTAFMAREQARLAEVDSLRATDEKGMVIYGLGVKPGSRVDLSDRDFFIYARDNPEAKLFIARPVHARISRKWVLPLGLRLSRPDGSFGGVVYANIALGFFIRTFSTINVGDHGVIALFDSSLALVARYPEPGEAGSTIGTKLASPQLRGLMKAGRREGTYTAYGTVDGTERMFSYLQIEEHRLYVNVGLAKVEYLVGWKREAIGASALSAVFLVSTLLATAFIYRSWKNRETATQVLRESEEKYRAIIENIRDTYYRTDEHGVITIMSPSGASLVGCGSVDELLGTNITLLWEQPELRSVMLERIRREGSVKDFEVVFRSRDGRSVPVSVSSAYFRDESGNPAGVEGVIRDITERKRAEEALREKTRQLEDLTGNLARRVEEEIAARVKNEEILLQQSKLAAMGEMMGAIAHQWRQPLNALGLMIQNLKDARDYGELDGEFLDNVVRKAMAQIQHMSKTIDDFRGFFQPDKSMTPFDCMQAVGEVFSLFSAQLAANDIALLMRCVTHGKTFREGEDIIPCPEKTVAGFRNEFEHVILNLINNARDAILERRQRTGDAGQGRLAFDFSNRDKWVIMRVGDNGGGIDPRVIDRIFEPYFTTKDPAKGTGLGLYMSKVIVEEHMGGRLTAENSDQGAVFTIELPQARGGIKS